MKLLAGALIVTGVIFGINKSNAASDTAQALQVVEAAISITQQSDLDFGTGVQGDAAYTVDPDFQETSSNASFLVSGEPNKTYSITLPADGDVVMVTGAGSSSEEMIPVNQFSSNPSVGGTLDALGQEELFVGATRDALLPNQVAGSYTDTFTVTVIY